MDKVVHMHSVQKESLNAVRQFECAIKWATQVCVWCVCISNGSNLSFSNQFEMHMIKNRLQVIKNFDGTKQSAMAKAACHNVAQMASLEFQLKWMGSSEDMVAQFLVFKVINHVPDCIILLKAESQQARLATVYWIGTASFAQNQTPSQSFQVKIFDLRCDFEWLVFVTWKSTEWIRLCKSSNLWSALIDLLATHSICLTRVSVADSEWIKIYLS